MRSLIKEFIDSQGAADEFDACRRAVQKHFAPARTGQVNGDLSVLARLKQISVERRAGLAFEGMIERDEEGKAHILLRDSLNRRRERFTLAHELGHWILQEEMLEPMDGKLFRGLSVTEHEVKQEEHLASLLAAEILMPYGALKGVFDDDAKLASLHNICRRFGVSRTAAVRRIADVCDKHFVFLQLVPFRFNDPTSAAEVDDAIFASARQGTLFDRDQTRLAPRRCFREITESNRLLLQLESPKGPIATVFEVTQRSSPVPHAFLLAAIESWSM